MPVDVLLGLQWGDEGKGKIVDYLTSNYDIVARFQGGPNAGHSLEFDGNKHVLHTIPSGIFHRDTQNLIGNGVVLDPVVLDNEINKLPKGEINLKSRLFISKKAHLILPTHRLLDQASEISKGKHKIGSTLRGIGPAYMDKTGRNGLRVGDLISPHWEKRYRKIVDKHFELLKLFPKLNDDRFEELENIFFDKIKIVKMCNIVDSEEFINHAIEDGKSILAEGAQGTLLDVDFGTYPFVTSSTTTCAGACTGLGIAPTRIGEIYGITKSYTTRVGRGPFPTEIDDKNADYIMRVGKEIGATTGRIRRCGWLDLVALKYATQINGVTQLILTKGDVLSGINNIYVCTGYRINGDIVNYMPFNLTDQKIEPIYKEFEGWHQDISNLNQMNQLPKSFLEYIAYIEEVLEIPVKIISVGPDRNQTIFC